MSEKFLEEGMIVKWKKKKNEMKNTTKNCEKLL